MRAEVPVAVEVARSVSVLRANQSESGAFVAAPDFAEYRYCWLRDASFVAHALDRVGETAAAGRYHVWAAAAIDRVAPALEAAIAIAGAGGALDPAAMPPARFGLDGVAVGDDWPNFQIDGYGTWLWSLREHGERGGATELLDRVRPAVERTARYLAALAFAPCYDVWEEDGGSVHTSTLGCVYGGLAAAASLLGDGRLLERAAEVREAVLARGRQHGHFPKSSADGGVDASTLWLCRPFGLVDARDPLFAATADRIAATLALDGGIRRHDRDTYYGSGAWPVLTASFGWSAAAAGDVDEASRRLAWMASRITAAGRLAEQYGGELRDPEHYRAWVERWGLPAQQLLWSHAMFVILADELAGGPDVEPDRRDGDREEGRT